MSLVKCARTWKIYRRTKRRRIPDLLLHAKYATCPETRIIIQSPSTDVLVCSTHFSNISCEELWYRTGVRDRHRHVPVHLLCQKLGQKLCKALPAFHAITGCDTTSVIASVGKKKAWEVLPRCEAMESKSCISVFRVQITKICFRNFLLRKIRLYGRGTFDQFTFQAG